MSINVLRVENLTKIYATGARANESINIQVGEQEIVGIIGPNGAGKTTLIRQILGLLKPTEGNISLLGANISGNPGIVHRTIGYVPQAPLYYPAISIRDSIRYMLQLDGISGAALEQRTAETITTLELERFANFPGYQLSGGIHKAALLAVAWAKQARLLVLDEPTNMIDILRKQEYWELIKGYPKEGRSVIIASHDMTEIKKLCDRIYFLVGGKTVLERTTAEILNMLKIPVSI
jgi:ABC-2 type transport system ATP-binding protein